MDAMTILTLIYSVCFLAPWLILFAPGQGGS